VPVLIGTTLDKYEVLQKVGEGGMATVYRGRHSTLDRPVAIKVLHPHLSSSTRNRTRFAREVEAIERLRHENILEIFDYSGNEVSDCYIVTEFVDGETLTALLMRRGRLPSEVTCLVALSLCRALGYAHAQGILHRDVKGDNIMVRNDGTVKLMDFGIARFLDETKVTMTGALVGSPAFMSPEQAKEDPLDQRSDLFALGTVLFYLVSGHLPFTGSNPSLILKNVIEGNRPHVAELVPTMSATLADIIERLMATSPDDRFTTAADVERHLVLCLAESHLCDSKGDPSSPEWALARWLLDPDDYEARLDQHLRKVLIDEGRRLLAMGDHLTALRLLNRLLSMDENNAEVLALVQGLHGEPPPAPQKRPKLVAGAALMVVALGVLALFAAAQWAPPKDSAELPSPAPDRMAPDLTPRLQPVPLPPVIEPFQAVPEPVRVVMPPPKPEVPRPKAPAPAPAVPVPAVPGVPEPSPPEPGPDKPQIGFVRLNTGELVAKVYQDNVEIGDTRDELRVAAGVNLFELRSPLVLPETVEVIVAPGERRVVPVLLQPRPARVTFGRYLSGQCEVEVNGSQVGTLSELGWAWTVNRPDQPLTVEVGCPDSPRLAARWSTLSVPEVQFSGTEIP
jgi:serine/threonine protein kinase